MNWRHSSKPGWAGTLRAPAKPVRRGSEGRGGVPGNNFMVKTSYAMSYCWAQKKRRWPLIWTSNFLTLFSIWQSIPCWLVFRGRFQKTSIPTKPGTKHFEFTHFKKKACDFAWMNTAILSPGNLFHTEIPSWIKYILETLSLSLSLYIYIYI